MFNVQCSMFNAQCSILGLRPDWKIWVEKTYKNGTAIKFTLADKEKEDEVGK